MACSQVTPLEYKPWLQRPGSQTFCYIGKQFISKVLCRSGTIPMAANRLTIQNVPQDNEENWSPKGPQPHHWWILYHSLSGWRLVCSMCLWGSQGWGDGKGRGISVLLSTSSRQGAGKFQLLSSPIWHPLRIFSNLVSVPRQSSLGKGWC